MDDHTTQLLLDLAMDANDYPLPTRIAALLHLQGVTEADLAATFQFRPCRDLPDPVRVAIQNAYRSLDRGGISPRLRILARQMTRTRLTRKLRTHDA